MGHAEAAKALPGVCHARRPTLVKKAAVLGSVTVVSAATAAAVDARNRDGGSSHDGCGTASAPGGGAGAATETMKNFLDPALHQALDNFSRMTVSEGCVLHRRCCFPP